MGAPLMDGLRPECGGVVTLAGVALTVTSADPADFRATTPDGTEFRLVKRSFTISRYEAICGPRTYTVRRTGLNPVHRRRSIVDAQGRLVGTTIAHPGGTIDLLPAPAEAPELDLAFIRWGLLLIDAPATNLRT